MHLASPPRPRVQEAPYEEWGYKGRVFAYLPVPQDLPDTPLIDVVRRRRSRREFGSLSREVLSTVLWFSAKTRSSAVPGSPRWEHRGTPSAGGRHPIDIIISNWPVGSEVLLRYDPYAHCLLQLESNLPKVVHALNQEAMSAIGDATLGTVLWHAAQPARTTSRYENGESLIWRDAGALISTTALLADVVGLSCCPLGVTGEPYLSEVLGSGKTVVGVGGCVVG